MPRTARKRSESGVYHVILRGINKQTVFFDDEDREVFLNRLKIIKESTPYELFAFCLMDNHVHLLIKETGNSIGNVFLRMLSSYVYWYNRKYERMGPLFQDRYKSEVIDNDSYLLSAIRYIHQNPVKAGIIKHMEEYRWSSYMSYIIEQESFIDTGLILSMLGDKEQYANFMQWQEDKKFLEFDNVPLIPDNKLALLVEKILVNHKIDNLLSIDKNIRDEVLSMIRDIPGSSIRQISRVTGVPISTVRNI